MKKLFFVLALLLIFLALLEGGMRFVLWRDGMNFDVEMWRYARLLKRASADIETGHEHRPGASAHLMGVEVTINSLGLRERNVGHEKPEGVFRILMLGDSLTFGWGVAVEETPSRLLEERLNAEAAPGPDGEGRRTGGPRIQTINAGVGNYNTAMEVAWFLREGLRYQPDLVVLNYFINDAEPTPHRRGHGLLEGSYAYIFLRGRLDLARRRFLDLPDWRDYYANLYREHAPAWRKTRQSIERLGSACASAGIPWLAANYPELHILDPYPFQEATDRVAETVAQAGGRFIDLLPALQSEEPHTLWVSLGDAHPNGRANRLMTERLEEAVRSMPGFPP